MKPQIRTELLLEVDLQFNSNHKHIHRSHPLHLSPQRFQSPQNPAVVNNPPSRHHPPAPNPEVSHAQKHLPVRYHPIPHPRYSIRVLIALNLFGCPRRTNKSWRNSRLCRMERKTDVCIRVDRRWLLFFFWTYGIFVATSEIDYNRGNLRYKKWPSSSTSFTTNCNYLRYKIVFGELFERAHHTPFVCLPSVYQIHTNYYQAVEEIKVPCTDELLERYGIL